ncbi:hypothetical protein F4777DRAFT_578724 [Nemania sp. FL0916]|nr:hypothetical protein F4777DRAFT_578724 [Nemania sp. FL0916]
MTNGKPQHKAHSVAGSITGSVTGSESSSVSSAASSVAGVLGDDTKSGHSPSRSVTEEEDGPTTQRPDPRPALGSREFSEDLVHEIRKVIRQEFLGAYAPNDLPRKPAGDGDGAGPMGSDGGGGGKVPDKNLSRSDMTVKPTHSESEDRCSRTPTPPPSYAVSMPLPPSSLGAVVTTTKPDQPRLGVRFSDSVTLVESPVSGPASPKKAPWAMHRRGSSMSTCSEPPTPEWGVMFDGNGFATARCEQVLRGLGRYLVEEFLPRGEAVIIPEKLGLLYSRFRIEREIYPFEDIFHGLPRREPSINSGTSSGSNGLATYHNRIGDFFTDLDCEYYLVPPPHTTSAATFPPPSSPLSSPSISSSPTALVSSPSSPMFPRSSSYTTFRPMANHPPIVSLHQQQQHQPPLRPRPRSCARPSVPALTLAGFAQFFTICILAHPDEEAMRLDKIARELALYVHVPVDITGGPAGTFAATATATSVPSSPVATHGAPPWPSPSPTSSTGFMGGGGLVTRGEKLPRQFSRNLLPVAPDAKSRKLLAAAVDDLLCDLNPASSSPLSEQNRRWSFAGAPPMNLNTNTSWGSRAPHLPPPPVPLPRSAAGGGGGPSSSSSNASLVGLGSGVGAGVMQITAPQPPRTRTRTSSSMSISSSRDSAITGVQQRQYAYSPAASRPLYSEHGHRRHASDVIILPASSSSLSSRQDTGTYTSSARPTTTMTLRARTRFELGESGSGDGEDSTGSDTATVGTGATTTNAPTQGNVNALVARPGRTADRRSSYYGQEHEREREKREDKDRDNGKEKEKEQGQRGGRERWWGLRREKEYNRDRERGVRASERDRDHDRDRDRERDRSRDRDREKDRDRDRERDTKRDRDRDRDREPVRRNRSFERRPPPGSRRSSDYHRISTAAGSTGSTAPPSPTTSRAGTLVVSQQQPDERGPTWSEVIRAQQQQQQQQKVKAVSFYDERERTYHP